jgi:hypothetical protein
VIRLVLTCGACPEQYDAFLGEERVGYLRLRHGRFYVECPDSGGARVYEADAKGDGIFCADERQYYLAHAVIAIEAWIAAGRPIVLDMPLPPNVKFEVHGDAEEWGSY